MQLRRYGIMLIESVTHERVTSIDQRKTFIEILRQRDIVMAPVTSAVHQVIAGFDLVSPPVTAHLQSINSALTRFVLYY